MRQLEVAGILAGVRGYRCGRAPRVEGLEEASWGRIRSVFWGLGGFLSIHCSLLSLSSLCSAAVADAVATSGLWISESLVRMIGRLMLERE